MFISENIFQSTVASKSPNEETLVDLGKDDGEYLEPMDTSGFGQKQKAKVMNESPFGVRRHLSGNEEIYEGKRHIHGFLSAPITQECGKSEKHF